MSNKHPLKNNEEYHFHPKNKFTLSIRKEKNKLGLAVNVNYSIRKTHIRRRFGKDKFAFLLNGLLGEVDSLGE